MKKKRANAGRRVRAAIDRIGDAYLALCLDTGRIYDLNPAAETVLAAEQADLLQRHFIDLIEPSTRSTFRDLEARLDAGEDSGPTDLVFARPNGDTIPVELTVSSHTIAGRRLAIFIARERTPEIEDYSTRNT